MMTRRERTNPEEYTAYAEQVVSGGVVAGIYVRQACERYLKWMSREDMEFRSDRADRVVNFFGKLHHYKGKTAGQRFILSDWQKFVLYHIYGFYWKGTDRRVIRNVYLQTARKQGKSMFVAGLSLYSFLADGEPSAECYIVANSAKQAGNLYTMARTLARQLDPKGKHIETYRDTLKFNATLSILKTLSYNPSAAEGANASFCVTDEYHAAPNSKMYDVMKSSQLQRKNPLSFVITTAGYNINSPCYEMRNVCTEILAGLKEDDTQAAFIYEMDEGDQWDDPKNFIKSNPNLNVTVEPEDITAEIVRAKNNGGAMAEVKTKTLNMWLQSADVWIDSVTVSKATKTVDLEQHRGQTCYLGVDLAAVEDLTAVSWLFPMEDDTLTFKSFYFLPSSTLTNGTNSPYYQRWNRNKYLEICPGNVTDYDAVLNHILRVQKVYDLFIAGVFYDSFNATQFAINATNAGLYMQPFSQTLGSYNKPTKEFERQLKSGKVTIDNNPITRWCIANTALKIDTINDNCKPVKGGTKYEKIDGVIAMITALGGMMEAGAYYKNEVNN